MTRRRRPIRDGLGTANIAPDRVWASLVRCHPTRRQTQLRELVIGQGLLLSFELDIHELNRKRCFHSTVDPVCDDNRSGQRDQRIAEGVARYPIRRVSRLDPDLVRARLIPMTKDTHPHLVRITFWKVARLRCRVRAGVPVGGSDPSGAQVSLDSVAVSQEVPGFELVSVAVPASTTRPTILRLICDGDGAGLAIRNKRREGEDVLCTRGGGRSRPRHYETSCQGCSSNCRPEPCFHVRQRMFLPFGMLLVSRLNADHNDLHLACTQSLRHLADAADELACLHRVRGGPRGQGFGVVG